MTMIAWRGGRLQIQTQVPRLLSRVSSLCRRAGGSRAAKRASVARAVRMMCIVTSEPVGNEQRCQLQSVNYVALTTRVNCSRLLHHYFCMYTV